MSNKNLKLFDLINTGLSGTCLIEASAGTGKTYTITSLIIRLILEYPLTFEQILVVTFTKAAVQELKERIRNKLLEAKTGFAAGFSQDPFIDSIVKSTEDKKQAFEKIEDALMNFDRAAIFTIHGFCQRILSENAFETGTLFDTELASDQRSFVQITADDFWRKEFYTCCHEFADYGVKKIKSPEYFANLLKKANSFDVKIIPELNRPILSSLESYKEYRIKLNEMWPDVKEEVIALLKDPNLKANIYGSLKPDSNNPDFTKRDLKIISMTEAMNRLTLDENVQLPVFKEIENFTASKIEKSTKKGKPVLSHKFFYCCDKLYNLGTKLQSEMDLLLLFLKTEFFKYADIELTNHKNRKNIRFFDDLLKMVHNALHTENADSFAQEIRQKYKAALVDEFQDTDRLQYEIFTNLFGSKDSLLCMIGDPKQAIYSFRGADIFSYMKAATNAGQKNTLIKNWRSGSELIKGVNTIFNNVSAGFVFEEISFDPGIPAKIDSDEQKTSNPPLTLWYVDPKEFSLSNKPISKSDAVHEIAKSVAGEIIRLINGTADSWADQVDSGDIAVLVRTNKEAQIVFKYLSKARVPCVLYSDASVFHSQEADELEILLTGIAIPGDQRAFRAALSTDMMGLTAESFDFTDNARIWSEGAWGRIIEEFKQYLKIWENTGFLSMFYRFISKQEIKNRLLSFPDGERRVTNILHLAELLNQAEREKNLGPAGLIKWFSKQKHSDLIEIEQDAHQLRLESETNGVKIITIHKSKGLEYKLVFCPFAWAGSLVSGTEIMFHTIDDNKIPVLDLGSDKFENHLIIANNELLAENIRLLYVALTRAVSKCYLVWGSINTAETSAIAYLFHGMSINNSEHKNTTDITTELKNIIKKNNQGDELFADLKLLEEKSEGTIELINMPKHDNLVYEPLENKETELDCRRFLQKIDNSWRISSYSSLILKQDMEFPDYDPLDSPADKTSVLDKNKAEDDIFSFPKGASAGIFFHDIFEHLDFTCQESEYRENLIKEKLTTHGFDLLWKDSVINMTSNVICAPLNKTRLTLQTVKTEHRVNELEFYFPLNRITPQILTKTFKDYSLIQDSSGLGETIESLTFKPVQGFMKGYIDMVFWADNKYYLVDWKSNHLGDQVSDYSQDALTKTMKHDHYILQYHLYTLAFHQYLKLKNQDYNYQIDFGGIFYIFIRGVDPDSGPEFGIYHDMPDSSVINALGKCLIPEFTPIP